MAANQDTGCLNGNTSTIFDGDRSKSKNFLREFDLLWEMNANHTLFTEPYKHINQSFFPTIKGEPTLTGKHFLQMGPSQLIYILSMGPYIFSNAKKEWAHHINYI
jgi:hypothetical protein